ncbi:MAG: HPF/RaiA family ribosome-associated protein [Spirochaetia bacterium]|nr:HPF/RaiA family ribosome-associated protein [Spirochaetia bacterium]MBO7516553.1 HPF/RaiA family ribosome-associated protein [Spirochaetia bacterium]
MNFEIRGIHYEVSDKTREQIEKKFKRLATAEDTLTFLEITVERANGMYTLKSTFAFKWGGDGYIETTNGDLYDAIDQLTEKVKTKIVKEKEKMQEKSN